MTTSRLRHTLASSFKALFKRNTSRRKLSAKDGPESDEVTILCYQSSERFTSAVLEKNKLRHLDRDVRLTRKRRSRIVVVVENTINAHIKSKLADWALDEVAVLIGPKARPDASVWELKTAVLARGGLLDIASTEDDFLPRLRALASAVERRHDAPARIEQIWRSLNVTLAGLARELQRERHRIRHQRASDAPLYLRGTQGLLEPDNIRRLFGLTRTDLARQLHVTLKALREESGNPELQEKLRAYEEIAQLLTLQTKPADFRQWLHQSHPDLNGRTPSRVIASEGPAPVVWLVDKLIQQHRPSNTEAAPA